jgi:hypothetical protein
VPCSMEREGVGGGAGKEGAPLCQEGGTRSEAKVNKCCLYMSVVQRRDGLFSGWELGHYFWRQTL